MKNEFLIMLTNLASLPLTILNLNKYIRKNNDVRFVFYHGIGDGSSPCMKYLNDEITFENFIKHLDYLTENYSIIPLSETIQKLKGEDHLCTKPFCNISFDDGLQSVYSKAFPVLKERNIPFDVFLNTSVIGNESLLWLHLLNYAISIHGLDKVAGIILKKNTATPSETPRNTKILEYWLRENFEYVYNAGLISKISQDLDLDTKKIAKEQNMYLDLKQIQEMAAFNVGFHSHTHSHFPLNAFSNDDIIKNEIETAHKIIGQLGIGSDNSFISYPFGTEKDYGKKAVKYSFSVGHKYVIEVGDGLNREKTFCNDKKIARVGLGNIPANKNQLYAAIEVRPLIKSQLRKILS